MCTVGMIRRLSAYTVLVEETEQHLFTHWVDLSVQFLVISTTNIVRLDVCRFIYWIGHFACYVVFGSIVRIQY